MLKKYIFKEYALLYQSTICRIIIQLDKLAQKTLHPIL